MPFFSPPSTQDRSPHRTRNRYKSIFNLDHLTNSQMSRHIHRFLSRYTLKQTLFLVLVFFFLLFLLFPSPSSISSSLSSLLSDKFRFGSGGGGIFGGGGRPDYDENWPKSRRAEAVKEAFKHAYGSYERVAMPADELRPLRNGTTQNFNGWGVSMYDALDTLWIMDLKPEFERALSYIAVQDFHKTQSYDIMFFETSIRYLGGLLSAYALSNRKILLDKADQLGTKLLPVFNTATGLAAFDINTDTGVIGLGPRDQDVVLAEFGSCQMEYKYLAHLTKSKRYYTLPDRAWDWFEKNQLPNGMWYTTWNVTTGDMSDRHITIGALADSAYEYLLKQYLMSGKSETRLRDMYIKSMNGMINNLLYVSPTRNIMYVTDVFFSSSIPPTAFPTTTFEHLSCFLPGLLALGVNQLGDELSEQERVLHMWVAEGLGYSCWLMYEEGPFGLAPEEVAFVDSEEGRVGPGGRWIPNSSESDSDSGEGGNGNGEGREKRRDEKWIDVFERWRVGGKGGGRDSRPPGVPVDGTKNVARPIRGGSAKEKEYVNLKEKYLLRPETIESLYVLWRITKSEIWRDRAWSIFLSIERTCRWSLGYVSVGRSENPQSEHYFAYDEMPSYALAETWKYLYLMFGDGGGLEMDKWVLNTEAHPFPVFNWTKMEKEAYRIPG